MKTWRKVMISALCVLAVGCLGLAITLGIAYYDKTHPYFANEPTVIAVSENIAMEVVRKNGIERVRLKDRQTGKYTTPQLQHVFINSYDKADSLVVFRTPDYQRGYLNLHTGKIIVDAQYSCAWNFSEGIAAVYKDGVVSFIRENGEPAFPQTFPVIYKDRYGEIAFQFHNGLCVMRTMENKWGLIDKQGQWVVEPVYNTIHAPMYGYRKVLKGDKYGLLTMDGKLALPIEYDDIREASDHRGFVLQQGGVAKEVDTDLNTIVPFVHDGLHLLRYVDEYKFTNEDILDKKRAQGHRFWSYSLGAYCGVIDDAGRVIIPAIYYNVFLVHDELIEAVVDYDGDNILFDLQGRVVGKADI